MFHTFYVCLVCPHLDYAPEIWNPYLIGDIQTLEKVQRRVTKLVPELRHLDYTSRLVALNLPSLLYRHRRLLFSELSMVFREYHLETCFCSIIPSPEAMDINYINISAI